MWQQKDLNCIVQIYAPDRSLLSAIPVGLYILLKTTQSTEVSVL